MKLWVAFIGCALLAFSCKQANHPQESTDPAVAKLKLPPGFHAERLYSPSDHDQGSWVAMTFDDKGRIIACDQYGYL